MQFLFWSWFTYRAGFWPCPHLGLVSILTLPTPSYPTLTRSPLQVLPVTCARRGCVEKVSGRLLVAASPPLILPSTSSLSSSGAASNVRQTRVVEKVSGRLLVAAVADPSERVRTAVLQALAETTALDDYMAQVWKE